MKEGVMYQTNRTDKTYHLLEVEKYGKDREMGSPVSDMPIMLKLKRVRFC